MKIRRIAISRDGVVSFSNGYSVVKAELEAILVKIIVLPEEEVSYPESHFKRNSRTIFLDTLLSTRFSLVSFIQSNTRHIYFMNENPRRNGYRNGIEIEGSRLKMGGGVIRH